MKRKTGFYALICAFALLFLSACGAKLHTELVLDTPTSGKRIINITIPKLKADEAEKVHGGMEAVDTSLKKHLPPELTFSGLTQNGEDTVGTFTLEFESLQDYQNKLKAIIEPNTESVRTSKTSVSITDSGLVKGVQATDKFFTDRLLSWAEDALVEDGVINKSDKSYIIDSDGHSAKVTYNGKSYESSSGNLLTVVSVEDNGAKNLRVELSETDSGLDVNVNFGYSTGEKFSAEALQQWLDTAAPEDAKINKLTAENGSSVSYSVDSLQAAEKSLQKLLGDETFAIKESDPKMNNKRIERTIDVVFNCGSVCSPTDSTKEFGFNPAQGWETDSFEPGAKAKVELDSSDSFLLYRELSFTDVSIESNLGEHGGTVTVTASTDPDIAKIAGKSIEQMLNPVNIGTLKSEDKNEKKVYTLTLKGDSQEELNKVLDTVFPGTQYEIKPGPDSGFFTDTVTFTYSTTFNSFFKSDSEIKHEVQINGYTIDQGKQEKYGRYYGGSDYHGTASKISLRAWILIGVIGALVLSGAGLLWYKRKAIAAKLHAKKENATAENTSSASLKPAENASASGSVTPGISNATVSDPGEDHEQTAGNGTSADTPWNESMLI